MEFNQQCSHLFCSAESEGAAIYLFITNHINLLHMCFQKVIRSLQQRFWSDRRLWGSNSRAKLTWMASNCKLHCSRSACKVLLKARGVGVIYFCTGLWLNQESSAEQRQYHCRCSALDCCSVWKKAVSLRCDRGVMEFFTGQRRTIDLSVGSLCPPLIHRSIHHSSASPSARRLLEELGIVSSCLPAAQIPIHFYSTFSINSRQRWSPTNNYQTSKHISLRKDLSLSAVSPCLSCPIYYSLFFICISFSGYWRKHWIKRFSLTSRANWIVLPLPHVFTAAYLYPLEMDLVLPSGEHTIVIVVMAPSVLFSATEHPNAAGSCLMLALWRVTVKTDYQL